MPNISLKNEVCTVLVTIDGAEDVIREMEAHAAQGLSLFAQFDGFVKQAFDRADRHERVQPTHDSE